MHPMSKTKMINLLEIQMIHYQTQLISFKINLHLKILNRFKIKFKDLPLSQLFLLIKIIIALQFYKFNKVNKANKA